MDINNPSVRWKENLHQSPTPSQRNHCSRDRPKSILRRGRSRSDNSSNGDSPSDEATSITTRSLQISEKHESSILGSPDTFGFVDSRGYTLSPIPSAFEEYGDHPSDERSPEHSPPRWKDSSFEKSLPPEYQQAFFKERAVRIHIGAL
jgi:hypothetical protein